MSGAEKPPHKQMDGAVISRPKIVELAIAHDQIIPFNITDQDARMLWTHK
jgi:hypothetical protein